MTKRRTTRIPAPAPNSLSRKGKQTPGIFTSNTATAAQVCSVDFAVRWEALPSNKPAAGLTGFSVAVSQRVRWKNRQQMWESVSIRCDDSPDGGLLVRVLVSDPEWKSPMQIAAIRSRPDDASCLTALGCNLDQVGNEN